jgi:hypothetical protein
MMTKGSPYAKCDLRNLDFGSRDLDFVRNTKLHNDSNDHDCISLFVFQFLKKRRLNGPNTHFHIFV